MKQGGDRKKASGFTIVETLIVLAVTGVLFISAALLINGRQNKTEFYTAANNMQQQLQQIINETASGYFPNNNNFTCTAGSPGAPTINPGAGNGQGTNGDCIFLGKVLEFGSSDQPDAFQTYALAGNRVISGQEVTTLTLAFPQVVTQLNGTDTLQNGLVARSMKYNGTTDTAAMGFISTLGSYTAKCKNQLCSGSQGLGLYALGAASKVAVDSTASVVAKLNGGAANYVPANKVDICFDSGTTANQSVLYTIGNGSGGNSPSVILQIQSTSCP